MILLCIVCIVIDVCIGRAFKLLHSNAIGGSTKNNSYILYECSSDVLIFGSSRASHHYVPSIISESTGLSCYNCGEDGNGIILAAARYYMLAQRYRPQILIYDLAPEFDLKLDVDNSKYLHYIKPYYSEKPIKNIIDKFSDWKTRLELKSNMYRNNSTIIANVLDIIIDRGKHDGYIPLYGQISNDATLSISKDTLFKVDESKYEQFEQMIDDAIKKDIKIIFVISPSLTVCDLSKFNKAREIATKYSIPLLNYSNWPDIVENRGYFQDEDHLNNDGAIKYSHLISNDIKNSLIPNK